MCLFLLFTPYQDQLWTSLVTSPQNKRTAKDLPLTPIPPMQTRTCPNPRRTYRINWVRTSRCACDIRCGRCSACCSCDRCSCCDWYGRSCSCSRRCRYRYQHNLRAATRTCSDWCSSGGRRDSECSTQKDSMLHRTKCRRDGLIRWLRCWTQDLILGSMRSSTSRH